MALKAILDSLDDVPEALHGEYNETVIGGKTVYALDIEGVDSLPATANLKSAYERVKADKIKLTSDLKEATTKLGKLPEDFDAAEWERLKAEDEARQADPDNKDVRKQVETATAAVKQRYENQIAANKKAHEEAIAEKDGQIAGLEGDIRRALVEDGLTKALVKAGVKPTLMKAAQRMFETDVEVVEEDGKRVARMKTDLGGDEVERFISNWAQSDDAKDFIAPMKGGDETGSGSRRSTGPNPFSAENWNITEQGRLMNADRGKAESMAKAAGFKDLAEANRATGPKKKAA